MVWRLIPAHAGKTGPVRRVGGDGGAHPRSRGENSDTMLSLASIIGSSPLTRGKQGLPEEVPGRVGLIPAHAGKTTAL